MCSNPRQYRVSRVWICRQTSRGSLARMRGTGATIRSARGLDGSTRLVSSSAPSRLAQTCALSDTWRSSTTSRASAVESCWRRPSDLASDAGSTRTSSRARNSLPAAEQPSAGFAEDGLGEVDFFGDPAGGNSMLILNQELRFPVYRWAGGVVFVDAGNVFPRASDISLTNLEAGAGFGLRINSPFALVRVDFGMPLTRRGREPLGRWYFGIGQTF